MTTCSTAPVDGPCTQCGLDETCALFNERPLCQDCWHDARERETPYAVFRDVDGYCCSDGAYLKEEAEERAREKTAEDLARYESFFKHRDEAQSEERREHWKSVIAWASAPGAAAWRTYTAKPVGSWFGHRTAHPAYMDRRRKALGGLR
jgi:hypothetical protein